MNKWEIMTELRNTLDRYSYHVSDDCLEEMARNILAGFDDVVEKAWMYEQVSE